MENNDTLDLGKLSLWLCERPSDDDEKPSRKSLQTAYPTKD